MKISTLITLSLGTILLLAGAIFVYIHFVVEKRDITKVVEEVNSLRVRRIVAFGDSLTYGLGLASIDDSYPSQLQRKLNDEGYLYKVINLGVSGETSIEGLNRIDTALSFEPDVVLLEFGANDAFQNVDPSITRANIAEMIRVFSEKKIKVILVSVTPDGNLPISVEQAARYAAVMPELAKANGLILVPSFLKDVSSDPALLQADVLHPTKDGYTKALNQNLWPYLMPQLVKQIQ